MKKFTHTLRVFRASVADSRRRWLISKKVALNHRKSHYQVSIWRYGLVTVGLFALFAANYVFPDQNSTNGQLVQDTVNHSQKIALATDTSINLALNLAEQANLPVAQDVLILSEMNKMKKEVALQASAELTVAKAAPIFDLATADRAIKYHKVNAGESLQQIADKYRISSNTIKWANNMRDDRLTTGARLKILPLDGIIYKVKSGDTLDSIANKYKANAQRIQVLNDLEVSGLVADREIVVPEGILPVEERPGYVPPAPAFQSTRYGGLVAYGSGGRTNISIIPNLPYRRNTYADGNCTWHAYEWRARHGRPVGPFWGNGSSWAYSARRAGHAVNKQPAPGAIFQTSAGWFGYGHVGIVEQVLPNGDIIVTEMNYRGYNVTTRATIQAKYVPTYNYIH